MENYMNSKSFKSTKFLSVALIIVFMVMMVGCGANKRSEIPVLEPQNNIEQTKEVSEEFQQIKSYEKTSKKTDTKNMSTKVDSKTLGTLEVHFIDVGQGDSILITQDGVNMLIDAGENDKGELVVKYLKSRGIETLDYVIGTHPHSDHIGGLDNVINSLNVSKVFMSDKIHNTKTFEDVLIAVKNKRLQITKPTVGKTYKLGSATFTILAPNGSYNDLNNYSIAIRVDFENNSFLFTGDAEGLSEKEMIASGLNLKADVLKAGHHGSTTSNSDNFVNKVDPDYVVIQVGQGNKYGHPNKSVLDIFTRMGARVYRNDLHGTIIAKSDGENIEFETKKSPSADRVGEKPSKEVSPPVQNPSPNSIKNTNDPKKVTSDIPQEVRYIGNANSKKLHKEQCKHLPKENNRVYFASKQEAYNQGFTACGHCKPW